jgi:hypothetical protein
MLKKYVPLIALLMIFGFALNLSAQTEDEIVSKFLKKTEKKHQNKIGFFTAYFSYGKLSDENPYNKYSIYGDNNIIASDPGDGKFDGAYRSDQMGATFGLMFTNNIAAKLGFEYWLKMGTNKVGDYNFGIAPAGEHENFNLISEVQVYGLNAGVDVYLTNPPNEQGQIKGLAIRLNGGGGYYLTKWEIWQGNSSYNLSTGISESNIEPLKGSAPGYFGGVGFDLPIRFLGMVMGTEFSYLVLNFTNVRSYNNIGEELYLTMSEGNEPKRVDLDFSGIRGKIELKKFFSL